MTTDEAKGKLERALRAAKRRALYWSGNPSFSGRSFNPANHRALCGDPDIQYEVTVGDVLNLQLQLEQIDGRKRKPYDPQAEFKRNWAACIMPRLARRSAESSGQEMRTAAKLSDTALAAALAKADGTVAP